MGVKEFHLSILSQKTNVDLPSVVFKAESLTHLHLKRCNLLFQKIPENMPFERLQVLRFDGVWMENQIFDKMISSCRFLTAICFRDCLGLETMKLEKKLPKYLKHFTFINELTHATSGCNIEIDFPTLETIEIVGSKVRFHDHNFGNLKSLSLTKVEFYGNTIEQSLLCIDAPNIEYFEYSGFVIPSISFTPTSTLKRSSLELYFRRDKVDDAQSWSLKLVKLLEALCQSEIHLNIVQVYRNNWRVQEGIILQDGSNICVLVKHLKLLINHLSSCPSVLNVLFYIRHPEKITESWSWQGYREKQKECEELGEFFTTFQTMIGSVKQGSMRNLKDISIEICDTSRKQWQPFKEITLLEFASLNINNLRFRLKWREAC